LKINRAQTRFIVTLLTGFMTDTGIGKQTWRHIVWDQQNADSSWYWRPEL